MSKTSAANAIRAAFAQYGFVLTGTGGNCEAFVRSDGAIEETITLVDEPSVPRSMSDRIALGTAEYGETDENPLTSYTVADALAALRAPSDEYQLLSLRLQNDLHRQSA